MSDYTEHLISQAGGDGDALDGIQRRIADCETYNFGMRNADKLAKEDAPYLLAIVRKQQAAIDDLLYVAEHKADRTKPVGQWWSEVIKGSIERHMGPIK